LQSAAGVLQPRFQETGWYPEGARGRRWSAKLIVVPSRQIQQALLYEWIGIFSEAAAAICLLFQKRTVHFSTPAQLTH
jgi:hypothetical protein